VKLSAGQKAHVIPPKGKINPAVQVKGQKLAKRGRAKKKQPELLSVTIPTKGGKKLNEDKEEDDPKKRRRGKQKGMESVAEFSLVGDWTVTVHLTGYTINVPTRSSRLSTSPQTLKDIIDAQADSILPGIEDAENNANDDKDNPKKNCRRR